MGGSKQDEVGARSAGQELGAGRSGCIHRRPSGVAAGADDVRTATWAGELEQDAHPAFAADADGRRSVRGDLGR